MENISSFLGVIWNYMNMWFSEGRKNTHYSSVISEEDMAVPSKMCLAEPICHRGNAEPVPNVFVADVVVASNSGHPAVFH
ncbi:hypothetical protein Y032_0033g2650 [Ancylostoma ceylanicum]|uniref:Uncharacterized protein n=1 Tax=Ancylostoma ceylanicum TaxID=53326 RepID=A0A016UPM0_9BILA|nr:hypothetical protein Y032_0033g2650 [Ancylostoma ceylanicum]